MNFEILDYKIIDRNPSKYISFPDIIQSIYNPKKLFMIYRSGDNHHPTYSILHILMSENEGKTWIGLYEFYKTLKDDNKVWNCPRLSYLSDGSLNIICDTKSSTFESSATFEVYILKSYDDGGSFFETKTEMRGMVPDKIISFKNKLYCANHVVDNQNETLTQLINCSIDNGKTWYDCNILARDKKNKFCEANIVNYHNKYLLAYLRNNTGAAIVNGKIIPKKFTKYISYDGEHWKPYGTLPIYGHRMTSYYDQSNNILFGSFRDTDNIGISLMACELNRKGKEKNIIVEHIEKEPIRNLYHCGYTGLTKINNNILLLAYYIKQKRSNPFIKLCKIRFNKKKSMRKHTSNFLKKLDKFEKESENSDIIVG